MFFRGAACFLNRRCIRHKHTKAVILSALKRIDPFQWSHLPNLIALITALKNFLHALDDWSNDSGMTPPPTKERILDAAEEIMWKQGFHSTGLNEILKAVGVPKGSFYHWFESKEHFGVELLQHYIDRATDENNHALFSSEVEELPMPRLLTFLESSVGKFEEHDRCYPCLVLKLASEVTDLSEPMREVLSKGINTWLEMLAGVFDEAKLLGHISNKVNSQQEAEIVRDLWAGAIQRSTIYKSTQAMELALEFVKQRIASYQISPRQLKARG